MARGPVEVLGFVSVVVGALAGAGFEGLSDGEIDGVLAGVRRPLAQLEGVRARAAAVQQRRRLAARGSSVSIDGVLAEHRRVLGEQQRLAPGEVQRVLDAGRVAVEGTVTGRAVTEGRISVGHARTIGRVLASLVGEERAAVEVELVELAGRLDPVAFGKAARRVQGRVQPGQLARAQRRQDVDRRFRATDTEDGGFAFSGLLYGTAAETARTAIRAFRRPDAAGERRRPAQRGADAFEQLCDVALRAGQAPARHGVRPQVLVTVDASDLVRMEQTPEQAAGVFIGSGQPVAGPQLRSLLSDCQLVRVVLDADRVPVEVSTTVRTVPAGLWRALLIRDAGCRWPGCDAPASWCDVAHAIDAYADEGRLSIDNAMLLCRRHHRLYDASNHTVTIDGTTITFPHLHTTTATTTASAITTTGGETARRATPTRGATATTMEPGGPPEGARPPDPTEPQDRAAAPRRRTGMRSGPRPPSDGPLAPPPGSESARPRTARASPRRADPQPSLLED
jgi:hypothetical protein